jgi:hypothetical protein
MKLAVRPGGIDEALPGSIPAHPNQTMELAFVAGILLGTRLSPLGVRPDVLIGPVPEVDAVYLPVHR